MKSLNNFGKKKVKGISLLDTKALYIATFIKEMW